MKRLVAFFITAQIIFVSVNVIFAKGLVYTVLEDLNRIIKTSQTLSDTEEGSKNMQIIIGNISLSVSPDGSIVRNMDGESSVFNYNDLYACNFRFLKLFNWNGSFTALVSDNESGKKKVIKSGLGSVWQDVEYDTFVESDIPYTYGTQFNVNDSAVYGDQLFIACDDGIVLVLPPCSKCYKLKKLSEDDILTISFREGNVKFNENSANASDIPISQLRQSDISLEEALNMRSAGALFIDVREKEEFETKHYEDSINLPLSEIGSLSKYDKNTVIIFFCQAGGRAAKALSEAQKMGFVNVYNLGSVDLLLEL